MVFAAVIVHFSFSQHWNFDGDDGIRWWEKKQCLTLLTQDSSGLDELEKILELSDCKRSDP